MTDARRHHFDVVLVWAFDRMARSVRHFLEVLDELNHLSIEFVSFRETREALSGGPWSLSSARSRNWKRISSSNGFEQE